MAVTPNRTLSGWLLEVLHENNGRASKWLALRLIEERYGEQLTDDDRAMRASTNEPIWENNTAWARNALVKEGLLQDSEQSGRGVWALTDVGRRAAVQGLPARPTSTRQWASRRGASASSPAGGLFDVHVDYKGHRVRGRFHAGLGRLDVVEAPAALAGQSFQSPSAAARAVVAALNPGVNPNRNGWTFWTVTGSGVLLQELR